MFFWFFRISLGGFADFFVHFSVALEYFVRFLVDRYPFSQDKKSRHCKQICLFVWVGLVKAVCPLVLWSFFCPIGPYIPCFPLVSFFPHIIAKGSFSLLYWVILFQKLGVLDITSLKHKYFYIPILVIHFLISQMLF